MIWSKWLQLFKEASVAIIYIISKNNFWGCPAPSKNHFFQKKKRILGGLLAHTFPYLMQMQP